MQATKDVLVNFLEKKVLAPIERNSQITPPIKKKIRITRTRLGLLDTAEKVEKFFWNCIASPRGVDSYIKTKALGEKAFEDVRLEFMQLCGRI